VDNLTGKDRANSLKMQENVCFFASSVQILTKKQQKRRFFQQEKLHIFIK
jgi:hypothetical protein